MIELRPYQSDAVEALFDYWAQGGGSPLVDMATGTGKSVVIAAVAKRILETWPDMRVLMLVHVRELVEQNAMALLRAWPGAPLGINSAGLGRRDRYSKILFASIQSVFREDAYSIGKFDLVIIDEAHLVSRQGASMFGRILSKLRDAVPDLRVAGFTATPFRLDSGRLDKGDERIFDDVAFSYGIADGVRDGWLSPLVSKITASEIDVSTVKRQGGEFIAGSLELAADKSELVKAAAAEIVERGQDRRSWLAFCCGVSHALNVRDAVRAHGISCETVTGETPSAERTSIIKAFKAGRIRCLTNANVLTTGFDAPGVDLLAMLRPTLSTGLYVQIAGRGTRLAEGKSNCLVLDFAGNVRRHGPVDAISIAPRRAKLMDVELEAPKVETVRAKTCPNCGSLVALPTLTCPDCGFDWPEPAPRHERVADDAPIMASAPPGWIPVSYVKAHRHEKPNSTPSLRVDYVCGLSTYSEWLCFEHLNMARVKAEHWWKAHGANLPVPASVDAARARFGELGIATHIRIRREGKFWRVCGWRSRRSSGREVEIDERMRVRDFSELEECAA